MKVSPQNHPKLVLAVRQLVPSPYLVGAIATKPTPYRGQLWAYWREQRAPATNPHLIQADELLYPIGVIAPKLYRKA